MKGLKCMITRRILATLFLMFSFVFLMSIYTFADTEEKVIDNVELTITGDIKAGEKNNASISSNTEGVNISKIRSDTMIGRLKSNGANYYVTEVSSWQLSDTPAIKVRLRPIDGYVFDVPFSEDNIQINGVSYSSLEAHLSNGGDLYVKIELPRLDGREMDDNNVDLSIDNVTLNSDAVASWDAPADANYYEIYINYNNFDQGTEGLDEFGTYIFKLKDDLSFDFGNDIYQFYGPGYYTIGVRACYDSHTKGEIAQSNIISWAGKDSGGRRLDQQSSIKQSSVIGNNSYTDDDSYDDDASEDDSYSDINYANVGNTVNGANTEVANNTTTTQKIQATVNGSAIEGEWFLVPLDTGESRWWFSQTNPNSGIYLFDVWLYVPSTSTWYRFNSQGFVTTGLKQIDGALYYFEEQPENQGAMYVNKSFGGYFFGPDGKAIIG